MLYLKQHTLNIDVETFSTVDISLGAHKYATGAELLLFAYSFNKQPVEVIDIAQGESIPSDIVDAIMDKQVVKKAWNAAFEIEILEKYFNQPMALPQWSCTMVRSAQCGYPLKLGDAAKAIGLPAEKDTAGKALINLFSVPRKPTKNNPATRIYPQDNPEKWAQFIEYNRQDVVVEMAASDFFDQYPEQPAFEHKMYVLDRQINKRGVSLDLDFIDKVISLDKQYKDNLFEQAKELSGLENPNSTQQLIGWLEEKTGHLWKSIDKAALKGALEDGEIPFVEIQKFGPSSPEYQKEAAKKTVQAKWGDNPPPFIEKKVSDGSWVGTRLSDEVIQLLGLRKELSNTSVKKYITMAAANIDARIYGTIQFNGAARTGRNAGRLIQPQNLPRIIMNDDELDLARKIAFENDLETLQMCYESVSSVLSQLIRTAIVAKEGHVLKVADLSAIEARVLAWMADEEHVLEVFRTHGKIYEATAAMMFKVAIESVTKESEMRQRGKTASLACGYQGGPNAITTMDTDKKIPDAEKPGLVKAWRAAHPNIVRLWYKTQDCAIKAIKNPGEKVPLAKGLYFIKQKDALLMYLPSGRYLMYPKAEIVEGPYGDQIRFWGLDQNTGKWSRQSTYGGKLVENFTQAIARDVLMVGMYNCVRAGYCIVFNVHDEIVIEATPDFGSLKEIEELMCVMPAWADGLPLGAEGFESVYYKK